MTLSLVPVGRWSGPARQHGLLLLVTGLLLAATDDGAAQQLECDPGMSFSWVHDQCLRCLQGTYKAARSAENCTSCPPDADGRKGSTRGDGATGRDDCYFRPYVKSFSPRYGPVAGGTRVIVDMGYFNNQTLVRAFVVNRPANCTRVETSVVCITPPTDSPTAGNIVIEMMDTRSEYRPTSPYNFIYLPDPTVISIANPTTFLSGGKVLTVLGQHLTSVAHPEMVVTRIYMKNNTRHFYSNCSQVNGTLMTCPTPNIKEPELFQDDVGPQVSVDDLGPSRRRRQTAGGAADGDPQPINSPDLEYYVRFHLDGAGDGGRGRNLSVFMDPVFHEFRDDLLVKYYLPSRHEYLYLRGRYLKHSIDVSDVHVTVGEATCVVISLDSNLLVCHPPAKRPRYGPQGPGPKRSHFVQVVVGNLRFRVGYLYYVNEAAVHRHVVLIMSLVSAGLASLLVLWAAVVWYQRRRHAQRKVYHKAPPDHKLSLSVESGGSGESEGSASSRGSSGAGDSLYTGNGSSEGTATTGVPSLEVEVDNSQLMEGDVETSQMMHIDVWSALEEPLKSRDQLLDYYAASPYLPGFDKEGSPPWANALVGSFGRVFRGEMDAEDGSKVPVAVKTLRDRSIATIQKQGLKGSVLNVFTREKRKDFYVLDVPTITLIVLDGFTSAAELPQFLEEALVMEGFDHPHILPLYGVAVSESLPFVVSEYMDWGDLRSYVKALPEHTFSPVRSLGFAHQVADGMTYLSEKGFVHRDLAARNCLINSNQVVKIGDFGLSRDLHGQDYYRVGDLGRPLPVKWMAIESLNLGKFSTKSDVWSFGVVMWELLTRGRTPYIMVQNIDLKDYINADNRLPQPEMASDSMYELMLSCWRVDPSDRPTFPELVIRLDELLTPQETSDVPEPTTQPDGENQEAGLL